MKRHYQFLFIIFLALTACNYVNRGNVDGGPCAYKSTPYPAKVIDIDTTEEGYFNLLLAYQFEGVIDTMWYYSANNNYVPKDEMERFNIKPGSPCTYLHKEITEGHCNPDIFVFSTEPFLE